MIVAAGSTDVTTYFVLRLAADGTELTGATITDMDLQYVRSGAAPSAKVDATALDAANSAHADNKAIEIDGTDQPGLYRVDWPDAAFAAGVDEVILTVKYPTAFTEHLRVELSPAALTVGDIVDGVLDEPFMDHADPATIGGKIGLIPLEEPIPPSAEETAEEVWAYESATDLAAAVASIQAALAGSTVVGASPIDDAGDITIYQGWDYDSDIGTAIEIAFPVATYGDLTTATVALKLSVGTTYAGTVVNGGTASQLVRWEFTAAQTAAMTAIHDAYVVVVTSGGLVYDIGRGSWEVRSRYEG